LLLLLVATAAARELSSQNLICQVTCDYWCSSPLLLFFFLAVVLLLLVATAGAGAVSSQNLICQATCDYWCSLPLLLVVFFPAVVLLLLLVATAVAGAVSSQNLICQVTCDYWCSPPLLLFFSRCSATAAGCHRCRSWVVEPKSDLSSHLWLLVLAAAAAVFFPAVVLLLLVATAAARELSSQNLICQVTCDYWCSPPLLLFFFRCSADAASCHRWWEKNKKCVRHGTKAMWAGGGEGEDTGPIVKEMRHQRKQQYTRQEIDLPPGRGGPTRQSCKKELVATMLLKKSSRSKDGHGRSLTMFSVFFLYPSDDLRKCQFFKKGVIENPLLVVGFFRGAGARGWSITGPSH
jgi:hypothetical protein